MTHLIYVNAREVGLAARVRASVVNFRCGLAGHYSRIAIHANISFVVTTGLKLQCARLQVG
jgi:hypothetical protein